ncbi:MAG: hypothetical protein RMM31_11135, partial [Anaerolineae bacterium]|nr:hypothetical protein [Anaerolineae bacterium]
MVGLSSSAGQLRRWFYPLVFTLLVVIAFLPLYTERPYDPRDTQAVITAILMRSIQPYAAFGWTFHVLTIALLGLALARPSLGGRALAAYFGLNHWIIAVLQTSAYTETYGFAVHTGALVACVLLGAVWLWVAVRGEFTLSLSASPRWRWGLLPLAMLAFWSPVAVEDGRAQPDFSPHLLLTSPEYGLAYCFVTPVLLFLAILAYPRVNRFALRVTAFNGLIYGVFNLRYWASPELEWMGVLHLPLLVLPLVALGLSFKLHSSSKL